MALRWIPAQLSGASRHRFALLGSANGNFNSIRTGKGGQNMKRKWFRALSLLLFLGLTACGGGGGGGGGGAAPPPASSGCVWGSSNWDACNWQ